MGDPPNVPPSQNVWHNWRAPPPVPTQPGQPSDPPHPHATHPQGHVPNVAHPQGHAPNVAHPQGHAPNAAHPQGHAPNAPPGAHHHHFPPAAAESSALAQAPPPHPAHPSFHQHAYGVSGGPSQPNHVPAPPPYHPGGPAYFPAAHPQEGHEPNYQELVGVQPDIYADNATIPAPPPTPDAGGAVPISRPDTAFPDIAGVAAAARQKAKGAGAAPKKPKPISRQTQHSKELINAFRPIKYFLTIIGQMPFVIKAKKDGTYSFKFYKFSGQVVIYFLMFLLTSALYLLVTLGIFSFIMDSVFSYIRPTYTVIVKDKTTGLSETWKWERYIVRHEMVAMIVVWSWLTVACAGSLYIVTNSKYYVHYMNYFNRVVQIMDMDMTPGVSAYLFVNNILSLVVAILLTAGFVIGFVVDFTAVTNTSSVISNFIFRLFTVEMEKHPDEKIWFQILGFVIMVYALFASRANVIQFLFFSQLLKNGSKIWNERLRKVLTHEITEGDDDQFERRLEPRLIYKDHLMIVQLYQMTEHVFGTILFSYYSLTIISVVMELYQLAALQGFARDRIVKGSRDDALNNAEAKAKLLQDRSGVSFEADTTYEHEILATAGVSLLLLMQNVFFCYRTTVDAAKAYEYAMKGFDILRRHGLMYCKNKTDRNFVLSLYFSFAKNNPLQLTAGGYFAVNKILLVTMSSTIVNWAISIYQTKVDQWK